MRVVLQRVTASRVEVDGEVVGQIEAGMNVLVAVAKTDTLADVDWLAGKIVNLRIFADETGKFNLSLLDTGGEVLLISQFTLYGDCRKGRRPGFDRSAPPELAEKLYLNLVEKISQAGVSVATGIFGAHMKVEIHNDGPVTFILDSQAKI